MSSANIELLLKEIAFETGTLRNAKKLFADKLAPDFSFFDFMRSDEMGLSNCFASLLNPNGTHGQGSVFLEIFLGHVEKNNWVSEVNNCKVITEKQANGARRIDIFLEFTDAIVGIENKPWAGDQNKQLSDYANYLNKTSQGKKWLLIYLCDDDPSLISLTLEERSSLERSGNFIHKSYAEIINWLNDCAGKARALPVRIFIEELSKFVRTRVRGDLDMSEENEAVKVILSSQQNFESAFDVFSAMEATKVNLLKTFRYELQEALHKENLQLVWDETMSRGWNTYSGFGVTFHPDQKIYLRFEFNNSNLNGLSWGFRRKDESTTYKDEIWNAIAESMKRNYGDGGRSPWWPWYKDNTNDLFGSDIRNWANDVRPWSFINFDSNKEPKLAKRVTDLAINVKRRIQSDAIEALL